MFYKELKFLLYKEFLLEWRERSAVNGLLLYVINTVMLCYLSFSVRMQSLHPLVWNTLFWIIILFSAINAVAKSFQQERYGRLIYYYSLVSPQAIIFSKIIYNAILMTFISFLALAIYALVLGNPVQDMPLFGLTLLLGGLGFAGTLTLISGIASRADNNTTLMAVLGFPIILPLLLMLIKLSRNALDGLAFEASLDELLVLLALNILVIALSYLLFPYIWRS